MTNRAEFVAYVRSLVGTPFHHQGRTPGVGLDCPGPLIVACWHFGLKPRTFDVTGYSATPDGFELKAHCDEHMQPLMQDMLLPGDVILVRWGKGPPQHLGILFDYPAQFGKFAMVHADSLRAKCVTETRVEFGRAMALVGAYAVPGLMD